MEWLIATAGKENMSEIFVEYRVRPVIRYAVTKFTRENIPGGEPAKPHGRSEMMGVFDNIPNANIIASALAHQEPQYHYNGLLGDNDNMKVYQSLINDASETEPYSLQVYPCEKKEVSVKARLDPYYSTQYVQQEIPTFDSGTTIFSEFGLKHLPILKGSASGLIYPVPVGSMTNFQFDSKAPMQIFSVLNNGEFEIKDTGPTTEIRVTKGFLDHKTGRVILVWNQPPGKNCLAVNYEYDLTA